MLQSTQIASELILNKQTKSQFARTFTVKMVMILQLSLYHFRFDMWHVYELLGVHMIAHG